MRVLYVATDLRDADILQQEVKKAAPKLVLDVCGGATEARTKAEKSLGYDVMLLDSSVGDAEQLALIQHIRSKQIPLPIALLAHPSTAPSSTLVSAADEVVTRGPKLAERLGPGLRMAIERFRVVATTLRENERLKRSEARLRLIIEALPAGVVLVDQAGKILAMNLAGSTLVGTSGPSDVVGRELYSLADADGAQRLRELVGQALTGQRGRVEFSCHGPDGLTRMLAVDALCIQRGEAAGQGSVLGVLSAAGAEAASEEAGVDFSFSPDAGALADERAALEQTVETMRADVERLELEATNERSRVQQLLAELERARATSAEHHAQRAALDEHSRSVSARVEELETRQRDEQTAMGNVVSRVDSLSEEATSLRQERARLSHEADALKQELLDQRRARLELEERIAAADVERERLTAVLASAQAAAESRAAQLDEEIHSLKTTIGTMTARERSLAAELDATKFEASRLRDDLGRETESRTRFEVELDRVRTDLQSALSAREADQSAAASRLAEAQAANEAASAREQSLREELEAASRARQQVEQAQAELQAALSAREAEAGTVSVQARELQAALDASSAREQTLREEIEAAGRARQQVEQAQAELQAALSVREAEAGTVSAQIGELQAALDASSAREQSLREEIEAAGRARQQVEQAQAELHAALSAREAEAGTISAQMNELQAALDASSAREQALREDIEAAGRARQQVEQAHAELQAALTARDTDIAAATAQVSELQGALEAAGGREQSLRFEIENAISERAQLQSDRNQLQATLAAREADVAAASSQLTELRAAFDQSQVREQSLRAELDTVTSQRLDADAQLATATQRISEIERALGAAADREQALAAELATLSSARAQLEARVVELDRRVNDADAALAVRSAELEGLSGELAAARFEAGQVRDDLVRETETRTRLESELEARTFDFTTLQASTEADREAFHARIAEVEGELAASRERSRELETHVVRADELERANAEMEARRQAAVARIAELEERRRDEQSALAAAAQRETDLAQELLAARDERARLVADADSLTRELASERDLRRTAETDLSVKTADLQRSQSDIESQAAAHKAEVGGLRAQIDGAAQVLAAEKESALRADKERRDALTRLEAEAARLSATLEEAAEREATIAIELNELQQERDARGRQAFELETVLAREREERLEFQARLQVLERERAEAGARADGKLAEMQRDHQEVVGRLQKLLEQAAAREFQAAALARPNPADRVRRRPAEKIGQLAAAMANDLNSTIADVAEDARRLLSELPEGTNSRTRAEQTLQTATRAGQLVRHLLRLSERESRMVARVEVSALVRTNEAMIRQLAGADIDLRFELAPGLPHVECDAEEVVQVLSTLIVTSRGALPLGGVIRVSTQDRGRNEGRRRNDQMLVLTVSAEGYGMVPVATAVCEEVVTRCGGSFNAFVDANAATTTLQASLPCEARPAESAPGWSQSA